jgi:DNA N-6-adenine-methyltransferase (Dam)
MMITQDQLFRLTDNDVAATTDDWFTPPWVFTAAALMFDLDVAAPVNPALRTCPAARYYTAADDGLTAPWVGLVWMNPPYSKATPWVERWAAHPTGMALLPALPEVAWQGTLHAAAHAAALISCDFLRPDGTRARLRWPLILAARGDRAVVALSRVAHADRYARGAYHIHPDYAWA